MRTHSSSNLPVVSSPNPSTSNLKRRNHRCSKQPFILKESPKDTMADQRTMAELLRAPTEGYAEAIVVPLILADQFELKHSLINMMTTDQFFGLEKDNPHDHIRGNLLERRTQDVLTIIENKSKVRNSRNKSVVSQVKSCDANSNSSKIAKLTHAVNQQTSAVTTAMTAILRQFQATLPPAFVKAVEETCVTCGGAHPYYQCLATGGNTFPELREYPRIPLLSNKEKLQELANTPLNQNCSVVILKKLPEKLGDPGKFLIPCGFSELKCKALADLGASINLMPLSVWKKLADFVIVDYESDPRVPLILGRPFLRTACALIDVYGEEMILRDGDERLTLNMIHDTSSYSNQPQRESINLIYVFNNSGEDFLEDLFSTNQPSGNPTFSYHPELTSLEVKNDIFDSEGSNVLPDKLLDLNSPKDLHPPLHPLSGSTAYSSNSLLEEFADELAFITFPPKYDDLQFDVESDLKEIEFLLHQDIDSSLKDSIDQSNLANPTDNFVDSVPKMFIDRHALDYSSPLIFDEYDDDFIEVESENENVYGLMLCPQLTTRTRYLTQVSSVKKNLLKFQDKKLATSIASLVLEDFDPPLYEPLFFKEVPRSNMLLPFSSENEEKVFEPGIHTSEKVHSSFIPELSHQGYKLFKINQIFKSLMKIFLFCGKDTSHLGCSLSQLLSPLISLSMGELGQAK
nr:hypothetical protein [Tanacetum cinerariifolium]